MPNMVKTLTKNIKKQFMLDCFRVPLLCPSKYIFFHAVSHVIYDDISEDKTYINSHNNIDTIFETCKNLIL